MLQPTKVTQQHVPFLQRTRFAAEAFNLSTVSEFPLQAFQGIRKYGLPLPEGVTEDLVVQYFQQKSPLHKSPTITADVLGFKPNFDCDVASSSDAIVASITTTSGDSNSANFVANITTPSCRLSDIQIGHSASHLQYPLSYTGQVYQGFWYNVDCSDSANDLLQNSPQDSLDGDHRILMTVADVHWSIPPDDDYPSTLGTKDSSRFTIRNASAVLCKSAYSVDKYTVSFQQGGSALSMEAKQLEGTASKLHNFTDQDLAKALRLAGQEQNATESSGAPDPNYLFDAVDPYFRAMVAVNNQTGLGLFMDPESLKVMGRNSLNSVSTLLAYEYLMRPEDHDSTIIGSITYEGERLVVKNLTAFFMLATVSLLSLISLLVVYFRPKNSVPCAMGSIGSLAGILASSQGLNKQLTGLALFEKKELSWELANNRYRRNIDQNFCVVVEPVTADHSSAISRHRLQENGLATKIRGVVVGLATVLLPTIFVISLEALQRYSDSNHGIMNFDPDRATRVLTSYIPALLVLLVATLYSRLAFDNAVLAPFRAARAGNAMPSKSVQLNLIGKFPLHAFWTSASSHNPIQGLTLLAAFASSFLSILVSGLYSVIGVQPLSSVNLQQTGTFNFTENTLYNNDNDAAIITSLIEYSNLSFPRWTYDTLLFPNFKLANFGSNLKMGSIDIRVPAFRPGLDCSLVPRSMVRSTIPYPWNHFTSQTSLGMQLETDLSCGIALGTWKQRFQIQNDDDEQMIGLATELGWNLGPCCSITPILTAEPPSEAERSLARGPADCPSVGFSVGKARLSNNSDASSDATHVVSADVNMVSCYQRMEKVTVDVRFDMPDFTISAAKPPKIVETSSEPFHGGPDGLWHFSLQQLLTGLTSSSSPFLNSTLIDRFTEALARGKDGPVPYPQWTDDSPNAITTLLNSASRLYATYMVQAMSQTMRIPIDLNRTLDPFDNSTILHHPTFTGTATTSQTRLKQNFASKIALQAVLGFMVLCALITYATQIRDWASNNNQDDYAAMPPLLREIPCSIAATATLLAGSKMASRKYVPEGTEWEGDQAEVWDGLRFRMGWWRMEGEEGEAQKDGARGEGGGRKRYGIDVEGETRA